MNFSDNELKFKPLTEGLGFHGRTVDLKKEVVSSGVVTEHLSKSLPTPLPDESETLLTGSSEVETQCLEEMKEFDELIESADEVLESLGGESQKDEVSSQVSSRHQKFMNQVSLEENLEIELTETLPVYSDEELEESDEPFFTDIFKTQTSSSEKEKFFWDGKKKKKTSYVRWSLPAAVLDTIVALAISLVFVVALLIVTKVNFLATLTYQGAGTMADWSLLLLFVCVMSIYMVISRAFFGCSLGEWAFELKLGRDNEASQGLYPVRVVGRILLVLATGFVFLPMLSFLFGRDLVGKFCGLSLHPLES